MACFRPVKERKLMNHCLKLFLPVKVFFFLGGGVMGITLIYFNFISFLD